MPDTSYIYDIKVKINNNKDKINNNWNCDKTASFSSASLLLSHREMFMFNSGNDI